MSMSEITATPIDQPSRASRGAVLGLAAVALVAVGDFLIFGHAPGINLFVFVGALGVAILLVHWPRLDRRTGIAVALAAAAAVPLIEAPSPLGVVSGLVGLGILALVTAGKFSSLPELPLDAVRFALIAPFRVFADGFKATRVTSASSLGSKLTRGLLVWTVPAVLAAVFITLFGLANPVIELGLGWLDPAKLLGALDPGRIAFWMVLVIAMLAWPLLRPKLLALAGRRAEMQGPVRPRGRNLMFGRPRSSAR